ncbi:MAG TPA: molybdopterin-guanine dinucleotide biosynthesis protein B [Gemmatimonadaceae bacterium]
MLAVVGRKNSGKTTLVVRLAAELHRRGHRVMTIKHGTHTFSIDPVATDTYRHVHEGNAERVAMAAPDRFALIMKWSQELAPEEIAARYMADADVVLCEGFKTSTLRKVEIHRRAAHDTPLLGSPLVDARTYCAVVTDDETLVADVPIIPLHSDDWLDRLASLVEQDIMQR